MKTLGEIFDEFERSNVHADGEDEERRQWLTERLITYGYTSPELAKKVFETFSGWCETKRVTSGNRDFNPRDNISWEERRNIMILLFANAHRL